MVDVIYNLLPYATNYGHAESKYVYKLLGHMIGLEW